MKVYAIFTQDGVPEGFFPDAVFEPVTEPILGPFVRPDGTVIEVEVARRFIRRNEKIPAAAVEITEDQYKDLIQNQGLRRFVNGEVVEHTPPPPPPRTELLLREFFGRLTPEKFRAIRRAAANNDALDDWIERVKLYGHVDVAAQETIDIVQAMRDAGLLTANQATALLRPA